MNETRHPYQDIVERAWSDRSYKERLIADPRAVLREAGFNPAWNGEIRIVENSPQTMYLVIPQKPGALSEQDLDSVAGGAVSDIPMSPYNYPYPYPAPVPYGGYPYGGPIVIGNPNYTPGPILNNGSWNL